MGVSGMLLIAMVSVYLVVAEKRRLDVNEQQDIRSSAFFLSDHAARLFEVASIALDGTAKLIEGETWPEIERSLPLHEQLVATAAAIPHIDDVWLNEGSGALRSTSFGFPAPSSNAADRDAFKQVRASDGQIVIGELIRGKVTNKKTFLVAKRLVTKAGEFNGMVSATADLTYFSDFWSRLNNAPARRISLVRAGSGEEIAQWPIAANEQAPRVAPALWTTIRDAGEAGTIVEDHGGLVASHGVKGLPLLSSSRRPARNQIVSGGASSRPCFRCPPSAWPLSACSRW